MTDRPGPTTDVLARLADLGAPVAPRSHRRAVGPLVVAAKRLVHALARRLLAPLVERQSAFNRAVVDALRAREAVAPAPTPVPAVEDDPGGPAGFAARLEVVHESLAREIALRESAVVRELRDEIERRVSAALGALAATDLAVRPPLPAFEDELYRAFEERFRGSPEEVSARLAHHALRFVGAGPVLDLGCGRGEFLLVLRDRGIEARGVDARDEMVRRCREQGLDAVREDALAHLAALPPGSLGGVFSAQLLEHLVPAEVPRLLVLAHRALRPGGWFVAETVNVESLVALTRNFFADWTHRSPLSPGTLRFLAERCGFDAIRVDYLSEIPEHARLETVPSDARMDTRMRDLVDAINRNVERLNALLYGPQDFALVARR